MLEQWRIYLSPWEFSYVFLMAMGVTSILYWRGSRVHRVNYRRKILFWGTMIAMYFTLHTHLDYYAERVFYMHRLQHVLLHHILPLTMMASYPVQTLRAGLPLSWRRRLRYLSYTFVGRFIDSVVHNKILIPFLFVFFVVIWLFPNIQIYSMIDWRLYRFMNWSVLITGFFYWAMILDRRPSYLPKGLSYWERWFMRGYPAVMSPIGRVISPILTMIPQMIAGGWVVFATTDLYPIFNMCGRALNVTAIEDQVYGGIIIWVSSVVVESFGILYAAWCAVRLNRLGRLRRR